LGSGHLGLLLVRVLGFELGWRSHAELGVKPPVVEPVDVLEGGELHIGIGEALGSASRLRMSAAIRKGSRAALSRAEGG